VAGYVFRYAGNDRRGVTALCDSNVPTGLGQAVSSIGVKRSCEKSVIAVPAPAPPPDALRPAFETSSRPESTLGRTPDEVQTNERPQRLLVITVGTKEAARSEKHGQRPSLAGIGRVDLIRVPIATTDRKSNLPAVAARGPA
jgi:hypothetical protein